VIFIKRVLIDPPEREEEELPELEMPQVEEVRVPGFDRPLRYQNLGIV
jgi:hypothetical protein